MQQNFAAICLISTRKVLRHGLDFRVTASLKSQCVIVVTMGGWADVGLWAAVGFLVKEYIGLHVKPRLHAWHSHRQSRSHFAFSSLSDQWEIWLFFIFRKSFSYKINVSFTMVIKRSPGGPCRWWAVNFEIHRWSSHMNAAWIWRSISIQHVQIEADLNSDPGNDSFWDKIRDSKHVDSKHVDRSTH